MASEIQNISPENRRYLNSIDFDVSKFSQLAGLSAIAAVFIGVTIAIIEFHMVSVILVPWFLAGMAIGLFVSQAIKLTKTNSPRAVYMAGLIAAIVGMIAMQTTTYQCFKSANGAKELSFSQYVEVTAEEGISFARKYDEGCKVRLGYAGTCIYWAIQAFILLIATISMLPALNRHPFCSKCGDWYRKIYLGTATMPTAQVASAITNGQFASIVKGKRTFETTVMNLFQCPVCLENGATVVGLTCIKDRSDDKDTSHLDVFELGGFDRDEQKWERMKADFTGFFQDRADKVDDGLFNISPVETAYLASIFEREDIEEALLGDVEAVRSELQTMLDSDNAQFTEHDEEADDYMRDLLERQNARHSARHG